MAAYSYAIATEAEGEEGLLNIEDDLGLPPPTGDVPYYLETHTTGEGKEVGDGAPATVWRWSMLTQAQYTILRAYCAALSAVVYITTRDDEGEFANYKAMMHWPKTPGRYKTMGQAFLDFEIEFTRLELQA